MVAGVLLVLGGVHPRIVGHADDKPGVDAGVGHGIEGIGGHIEAHVLHAAESAFAGQAGAEGRLHGYLLVGGPLAVDLVVLGSLLGDLRAGGSGVAGNHAAPRLIQSPGNGGVAQHQFFHCFFPTFSIQTLFRYSLPSPRPSRRMTSCMTPPAPLSSMDRRTRLMVALLAPVFSRMSR